MNIESITVIDDDRTITVPIRRDAHGWIARHGDMTIHVSATVTGPAAVSPAKARLAAQ
jgi:hypothetical protein